MFLGLAKTPSGAWVAQSVHPTPDFGSDGDLTITIQVHVGLCAVSTEPAWDSLSPALSAPPMPACSPSLSK